MSACTQIDVEPLAKTDAIKHICIEDNPKVIVRDFVPVVQAGLKRHGIESSIVYQGLPAHCEYSLRYTALRSWDIGTYLSHAELSVHQRGRQIASATYHLTNKGGFSLMKWQGTKTKMDPVIDELLAAYR